MTRILLRVAVTIPFSVAVAILVHATGLAETFPWLPAAAIASATGVFMLFSERLLRLIEVWWLSGTGVPADDIRYGMRLTSLEEVPFWLRRNRKVYAAFLMLAWRLYEPNEFTHWNTRRTLASAAALALAKAERVFDVEHLAELIDLLAACGEVRQKFLGQVLDSPMEPEEKMAYFRASQDLATIADAIQNDIPVEYMVAL